MKQKLNCILLIDDDEPTNYMSTMVLEEAECTHHIQVAESGQQALDYLSKRGSTGSHKTVHQYPELIFLDINMPAMNGWEFLARYEEVKTKQQLETIVIMLTTSINPDDKSRAEKLSVVNAFESKPLTFSMIERVIKKYFSAG